MVSVKKIKTGEKLFLVDGLSVSKLIHYFTTPGEIVRAYLSVLCSIWASDFLSIPKVQEKEILKESYKGGKDAVRISCHKT